MKFGFGMPFADSYSLRSKVVQYAKYISFLNNLPLGPVNP